MEVPGSYRDMGTEGSAFVFNVEFGVLRKKIVSGFLDKAELVIGFNIYENSPGYKG